MQGDPETIGPVGQGGDWVLQSFLCIAWRPRCLSNADGCFLGRSVSLTFCGPSFIITRVF
jgi:hypothetical protein